MKGIDRSVSPLVADKSSFYSLRNFRQQFEQRGVLEQTPAWYSFAAFVAGTYYNGGSQTEPSTSGIRMVTEDLAVTDYVMRTSTGQAQVFYQTTYPTAETIYTGCRLVINTITGLAITLGQTLDVVIEAAGNTFKWRKNGGAYTLGLACSTSGTSIDGGNATVYFLASSGFTPADTWSWTRLDRSFADTQGSFAYPLEYLYYKGNLYFNSVDDRVMFCTKAATSNQTYVISLGYRPVVGAYMTTFDDHLVVTWFSKNASGWTASTRWNVVGWSDKTDLHNFIPTDTNEADQYAVPNETKFDTIDGANSESFLMGVGVISSQLYLFTNNEAYYTSALGLPLVFSFQKLFNLKLVSTYSPIIKTDQGFYIIGYNDIYFFDGSSLKSIGGPVIQGTDNGNFEGAIGCWDPVRLELSFALGTLIFCYQAKWQTWYTRLADFNSDAQAVMCMTSYTGDLVVGIKSLKMCRENTSYNSQPVFDDTDGTTYAKPYLITQLYGDDLSKVKVANGFYLGAVVNSSGITTTYYTTGTGITVQLSYWSAPAGAFTNVSEVTPTSATWTKSKPDGMISLRTNFRSIAFALEVQGTTSKPPAGVTIQSLAPLISDQQRKLAER